MATIPVVKSSVVMDNEDHLFLMDDRFNDFANQVYGYLADDLSPENVFHILELALAYEYDCAMANITDKPEKWVVD